MLLLYEAGGLRELLKVGQKGTVVVEGVPVVGRKEGNGSKAIWNFGDITGLLVRQPAGTKWLLCVGCVTSY